MVGTVGNGPGVARAACGGCTAAAMVLDGGTIVGRFVSITTRSSGFSIELILIADLSMLP